jgi:membrane-bound lytic murein transglycosylase B
MWGAFPAFLDGLAVKTQARGIDPAAARTVPQAARPDERTLRADANQGIFRLEFVDFARRVVSARPDAAQRGLCGPLGQRFRSGRGARYGVPRGVLLAFCKRRLRLM